MRQLERGDNRPDRGVGEREHGVVPLTHGDRVQARDQVAIDLVDRHAAVLAGRPFGKRLGRDRDRHAVGVKRCANGFGEALSAAHRGEEAVDHDEHTPHVRARRPRSRCGGRGDL